MDYCGIQIAKLGQNVGLKYRHIIGPSFNPENEKTISFNNPTQLSLSPLTVSKYVLYMFTPNQQQI